MQQERRLGQDFEREVEQKFQLIRDRTVDGYVSALGQRIAAAAGPQPFAYEFHVIDDPEINAFAGPAGQIYLNSGVILRTRNMSELAGVMAHEIGHVARRHVAQNLQRQQAAGALQQLGVLAGGLLYGQPGADVASIGSGVTAIVVLNSFSRDAEQEADAFAVEVLPKAGIDPHGLVGFFETLQREKGSGTASFLSTHPATAQRIAATRAQIAARRLPSGLRVDDGGKLDAVQRRLRQIAQEKAPPRRRP